MSLDYQGASAEAIRHHYDVGNDFYALWLDPRMIYSCALFDGPDDTLAEAQVRKLDYIAGGAGAFGRARVLDVGCGWGGMMRRLVEDKGVGQVTGLTLSQAQADAIADWADDRYDVRVQNWRDHTPEAPYDAIVSIGAFEHFADFGLGRAGRVAAYREFFERCRDWLPPGGRLALQTITKGNNNRMDRQMVKDLLFVADVIFPESELPWPSEFIEASERLFELVSVRNDPEHYARTCESWHRRLLADRERVVALNGEEVFADYDRYLSSSVTAFERNHLGLTRTVLQRVG